jgi:hypothetical protein
MTISLARFSIFLSSASCRREETVFSHRKHKWFLQRFRWINLNTEKQSVDENTCPRMKSQHKGDRAQACLPCVVMQIFVSFFSFKKDCSFGNGSEQDRQCQLPKNLTLFRRVVIHIDGTLWRVDKTHISQKILIKFGSSSIFAPQYRPKRVMRVSLTSSLDYLVETPLTIVRNVDIKWLTLSLHAALIDGWTLRITFHGNGHD